MHKILILFFCCLLFSACGRSSPTNYYLLESPTESISVDSMPKKSLRVAQVEIPGYLNRNDIVSRVQGQTRLILAEFHLWAEPVNNGVRRVVEEVLTPALLAEGITVLPGSSESSSDYTLLIDIQRFDGNFNEKAVLQSKWTLLNQNDAPVQRGIYTAEEQVNGADYNILVNIESKLVHEFGKHLAERIPLLMRNKAVRKAQ